MTPFVGKKLGPDLILPGNGASGQVSSVLGGRFQGSSCPTAFSPCSPREKVCHAQEQQRIGSYSV